jgi:hypothetical protein
VTDYVTRPAAEQQLVDAWKREEQQPFAGWDFSRLAGGMQTEHPPWSYAARAAVLLRAATSVVDLGTGGGERFLELRNTWPLRVAATEQIPENLALATERLAPFGVRVVPARATDIDPLPFGDEEFDLVLNRHAAFNCNEVERVLVDCGRFVTQQVHGRSAEELQAAFGARPLWPDAAPEKYSPRLEAAGLEIVQVQTWTGRVTFGDVGALVYYLKAVPWTVPGFSVATHREHLLRLQRLLDSDEPALTFPTRLYLIPDRGTKKVSVEGSAIGTGVIIDSFIRRQVDIVGTPDRAAGRLRNSRRTEVDLGAGPGAVLDVPGSQPSLARRFGGTKGRVFRRSEPSHCGMDPGLALRG